MTRHTDTTPKADGTQDSRGGRQRQTSEQSMGNPATGTAAYGGGEGRSRSGSDDEAGIGSSQAQDRETPNVKRPSSDKSGARSDVERGEQEHEQHRAADSLVNDSTGAFKERP
jgi:hypothetical protein